MRMEHEISVAVLRAHKSVDDNQVNDELRSIWQLLRQDEQLLRQDETLRKQAREAGIDDKTLESLPNCPYEAKRSEGQFGVAETILIAVAGGLAKDAIKALWNLLIWPRLARRFGAALELEGSVKSR